MEGKKHVKWHIVYNRVCEAKIKWLPLKIVTLISYLVGAFLKSWSLLIFLLWYIKYVYRFSSDSFFPVDGQGYMAENQLDCSKTYHNFG